MRQPFKTTSLNVKERTLALSGAGAVVSVSESPEHPTHWLFNSLCFPLLSAWALRGGGGSVRSVRAPTCYLPQSLLIPIAESAGSHSTRFTSEEPLKRLHHDFVSLLSLSVSLHFFDHHLCFQTASPPFKTPPHPHPCAHPHHTHNTFDFLLVY